MPVTYVVSQPHDAGGCLPGADAGSTPAAAKAMKDGEKKGWMAKRHKKNAQEEAEENELTEMDEEPEENAVPTSEDEKEDLENDSNL